MYTLCVNKKYIMDTIDASKKSDDTFHVFQMAYCTNI